MSSDQNNFYKAFEDQHRGSRETIKSRLAVYMPFIQKIQEIHPNATALDLGCGRGEWLELLKDHQLSASGIDLDDASLQAAAQNFDTRKPQMSVRFEKKDAKDWTIEGPAHITNNSVISQNHYETLAEKPVVPIHPSIHTLGPIKELPFKP